MYNDECGRAAAGGPGERRASVRAVPQVPAAGASARPEGRRPGRGRQGRRVARPAPAPRT